MTFTKTRMHALAATAMAVVMTTPAYAQDAGAEDDGAIVVTARRIEENIQDVPISISVYNQEQLSARNIVSSTDLAAYTPSLSVNGRYGSDKSSFAIRGFSQDLNTLPTVGVYFADAVAPRLSSNITSGNGAGVGSMFDLQNVQVLKGPQGTLFGRNTTGGAILLVPRKPTDRLEGYVEGTYGSHDVKRIEAVLNVPLADTFKVRLGIDRNQRDGWLNNKSGIGPARFADVDYFAARLSIVADLTPDLENYTVVTYSKSDTHGAVPRVVYCNRGTVPGSTGSTSFVRTLLCGQVDRQAARGDGFYDVESSVANPFVKGRQWQAINTTTWKASDTLTVKNIVSYGEAKESYSFHLNGDFVAFPFVETYPGPARTQGHQWTFSEELQLQGNTSDDALTWQIGGYMERSSPMGSQEQYTSVWSKCTDLYAFKCTTLSPLASSISIARNNYFYRNHGVYAQATYKLSEQFSVTAGIRNTWDWQKVNADNIRVVPSANGPISIRCSRAVTPPNPNAPGPDTSLLTSGACGNGRTFRTKSSDPTWMIDLEFRPVEDIMLYAKYARGYRGGGLNEANVGIESWDPETVDSYELGFKSSFSGAVSGTFNLTGFWNDFKNQQASVFIPQCVPGPANPACTNPAPTGINGIQNVATSRLRGIEADATVNFGGLRIDAGYAYLDAKAKGGSVPFCDNSRFVCSQASFLTRGTVLPYAPKHRLTATATYTLPLDESIGKISVGATFTHTAKQFSGHSNDLAFAAGAIPFNASLSPATDLLNLSLNWKGVAGSPVDLALFATNVTKEKYWVAAANGLSTLGGESVMLGEPRMYGMRLKFRFGD